MSRTTFNVSKRFRMGEDYSLANNSIEKIIQFFSELGYLMGQIRPANSFVEYLTLSNNNKSELLFILI